MAEQITFEGLAKDIQDVKKLVTDKFQAMDENDKDKKEAKKAMDEKHEDEKKEAKKASRTAALKKAMDEKDEDKRDAAIKKAMDDDDHPKDHTAMHEEDEKKEAKKAMDEKEEKEHVASIIEDSRQSYIKKILTANTIINPNGLKEVEARLKTASITDIKKEWNIWKPAFEGSVQSTAPEKPFVPYYASANENIDESQLNASSPDSEFAKLSTKELRDMYQ